MPIFDNELISNNKLGVLDTPEVVLESPSQIEVDKSLPQYVQTAVEQGTMGLEQLKSWTPPVKGGQTLNSPLEAISRNELQKNQRYPLYSRGTDLENIYGTKQPWYDQLANGTVKFFGTGVGTFAQSFATIPNTVNAIKSLDVSKLSNPDGYEASIDNWLKNFEDKFPNYYTRYEREHPFLSAIPFNTGSANFWGDKIIKNLGFTAGAIGGAVVQDFAVGAVTGGLGEIPLLANQLGKASLYLNKIFTGVDKLDDVLTLAKAVGKTEKQILNIQKLAELAATAKINSGFKWATAIYGSSRTEAAIEARDSYRVVKEELERQYRLENGGNDPSFEEQKEIDQYAENAMNTRFGINMGLLTVSNTIQFGNLFKSFTSSQKALSGQLTQDIAEVGKIGLAKGSLDTFERKGAEGIAGKIWESVRPSIPNVLSEGVYEEGGQYATEKGVYDYFTRKYKNPVGAKWNDLNEVVTSTAEGLREQFATNEGVENMLIGAISAMVSGGVMGQVDKFKGQGKDARLQASINTLNRYGITSILQSQYEDAKDFAGIANDMQEAVKSGDIFKYKNLKDDMFFKFVSSRIPQGLHDITVEQLQMLKGLSKEDFEKTFGLDFSATNKDTVVSYVDSMIAQANHINKVYKSVDSNFKNPFKSFINPETEEDKEEALNHDTFNRYKTELAYLASKPYDLTSRANSVENEVLNINPEVSADLLASLLDRDSLKELSRSYEQKANELNTSLEGTLSIEDKKNTRNLIKALRTNSEKINLALNSGSLEHTLFEKLLNFEVNGQDISKEKVVPQQQITDLLKLGHDLNKINNLKKQISDIYDVVSSKEGFLKYFKQKEEADVIATKIEGREFSHVNKSGEKQPIELGREYSIESKKKGSIKKLAEDRWQVKSPSGAISFFPTEKEAKETLSFDKEDFKDLKKVKILALNNDGTVKVEDLKGNIYNIDQSKLDGYEKLFTEQEKLQKHKDIIEKQLAALLARSGTIHTNSPEDDEASTEKEDLKKETEELFISTTSDSEDWDANILTPATVRNIIFLNNFKNLSLDKRNNIKAMLVTPNQEKSLGLEGLTKLSMAGSGVAPEQYTNIDNGFIAVVYVEKDGKDNYFVDKNGNRLGKVGEAVDVNSIVFSTMPTTSITWSNNKPRYRKGEEDAAKAYSLAWKQKRQQLFALPEDAYEIYDFSISRGISNILDKNPEINHVGGTIVKEEIISTQEGLIQISTTGTLSHQGKIMKFPKGRPVLQYQDTLQFLNNGTFSKREAQAIFAVIKALSDDITKQSKDNKEISVNADYIAFLQNILYWKKDKETSGNQIYIDTDTMELSLGGKKYDLTKIAENEKGITDKLEETFNSVNDKTLKNEFSKKFVEYYLEGDKLSTREWKNYQTYLLSSKYPDGSSRNVSETPLFTNVNKPTDAVPYNYKQKYATLHGIELPVVVLPKPEKEEETGKEIKKSFKLSTGEVPYTLSTDEDGDVVIDILPNEATKKASESKTLVEKATEIIKSAGIDTKDLDAEAIVIKYVHTIVSAQLAKEKEDKGKVEKPEPEVIIEKDRKTEIKEKLKSIDGSSIGFSSKLPLGTSKWTKDGIKVTFVKTQRDRYGRGNELFTVTNIDGSTYSITVDYKRRPSDGFSDTKELAFSARYSENPKPLLDELAALEGNKTPPPAQEKKFDDLSSEEDSPFRKLGREEVERLSEQELQLFKEWAKDNVPNIPFEVLENIITINNTERAWGVFENGIVKFYKSAARGTEYHEVFEGIWKSFLTENEREAILDEFRGKRGQFTDRASGKKINYDEATDLQAKERIADDFADFRVGKLPARSLSEKILNFFKRIVEFFKQFVSKPSKKQELFEAINSGKYKDYTVPDWVKRELPEYSRIGALSEKQINEFVNDMAVRVGQTIFKDSVDLFDIQKLTSEDVFGPIKESYIKTGRLDDSNPTKLSTAEFNGLVRRTKEFIRPIFKVSFDENDVLTINDENADNRNYAPEPFATDWKKSSPFAIKVLLGTMAETDAQNQEGATILQFPKLKQFQDTKGYKLLNFSRAFATLLDKLSNTSKVSDVVSKLVELSKYDSNYIRLLSRLKGDLNNGQINFSKFESQDWRLFINFYQVFTKQKPSAFIQYVKDGEVYTAPANMFTTVKNTKNSWVNNIRELAKAKDSLISFNKETKTYQVGDLAGVKIKNAKQQVDFLNSVGIQFPYEVYLRLKENQVKKFLEAVSAIHTYVGSEKDLLTVTGKTLQINTPLETLAELLIQVTNPNQEVTHVGIDGKKLQNFTDNNTISIFENTFNSANTLDELLAERPELNDIFSANSQILKKGGLFFNEKGDRIRKIKVGYVQGTNNLDSNKETTGQKLTEGDRFTQEINQNLNGRYYTLVPADSSTEWLMDLGNNIQFKDVENGNAWDKVYDIFKGYLKDDINIAKDNRAYLRNTAPRTKDLRFFEDILSEGLKTKIKALVDADASQEIIEEFINKNLTEINGSVKAFITDVSRGTLDILLNSNQIKEVDGTYMYKNLDNSFAMNPRNLPKPEKIDKLNLSEKNINDILTFANVNYIINNIEYHKILFGDPYQFKIKEGQLDETKRIKSALSAARVTFDSSAYNTFLNQNANEVGKVSLDEDELGYWDFKSYLTSTTIKDVEIEGSLMGKTNEADAASWLLDGAYREVKLKNGQWNLNGVEEKWHQWQMAYTRLNLPGYVYKNPSLRDADKKLVATPEPDHTIEVLKPIVRGTIRKDGKIQFIIHKYSQTPLYYKVAQNRGLGKLYEKMWKEKAGYVVMESGEKVGTEGLHDLYNQDGLFNEDSFNNSKEIPFSAYSIQVENSYEGPKQQTMGSQITKIASLDLFNNGAPTSPEAKKEYDRNTALLSAMHKNSYINLLEELGIEDLGGSFRLIDNVSVSKVLQRELLKREMSENVKDTLELDKNGEFKIPFEASTHYIQIRDILFSMVDKSLVSPKVNGGSYVQTPVTLWEDSKSGRSLVLKEKITGGFKYTKITREEYYNLSEEKKKDVRFTDDTLKFYTKEDPFCEILLPCWFKDQIKSSKKFKTDDQILNYLNKTEEGKAILKGIGFRIPTQSQSSIEAFRVKGFLPSFMGKTVVVPSEITTKAGSDFDIDKLNMYLKSVYIDNSGGIKLIKLKATEKETKDFFGQIFDKKLEGKKFSKPEILEALQILSEGLDDDKGLVEKYASTLNRIVSETEDIYDAQEKLMQEIEKLSDAQLQKSEREKYVKEMYKKALENEYYDSLEKLVILPENFERLITPVDDAGLQKVSEDLDKLRGKDESKIKNRLLNRNYMTSLRHAFLLGKKWIGIVAVNITGHSLTQKSQITINPDRVAKLSPRDRRILGDLTVAIPHNQIDGKVSISGRKTADGKEFISTRLSGYATSVVDIAKNPYILKIIKNDLAIGPFMFLERIGAGANSVWFMNQPIIAKYLEYLESIDYKNVYNSEHIKLIKARFIATEDQIDNAEIDPSALKNNIETYYSNGEKFSKEADNAVQQKVLDEFLKYSKMAEYSFKLTQASNYDTTSFRSTNSLFRKLSRTSIARERNIFDSVDKLLESTHLNNQMFLLSYASEAMGEILKLDKYQFRQIINEVLKPYAEREFFSDDKYETLANKLLSSFLDFVIQTNSTIANQIEDILVDSSTSVATKLAEAKKKYPGLQLLNDLEQVSSGRADGAVSVKLKVNLKEAYDENLYTSYFRELKAVDEQLYKNIVKLAILQGTVRTPISIKNIIPLEDYSAVVAPIIAQVNDDVNLESFLNGAFQRNNWKDKDVFKTVNPKFFPTSEIPNEDPTGAEVYSYYSYAFPNIAPLQIKSTDRRVLVLGEKYNYIDVQSDYILVPRVVKNPGTGAKISMSSGTSVTPYMYATKKAKGDMSLKDFYGYKKVYTTDENGNSVPFVKYDKDGNAEYVYKLINLWGDGMYASEYYNTPKKSVLNNGTVKIENEIPDSDIISFFSPKKEVLLQKDLEQMDKQEVIEQPINKEIRPKIDSSKKIEEAQNTTKKDLPIEISKELQARVDALKKADITIFKQDDGKYDVMHSDYGIISEYNETLEDAVKDGEKALKATPIVEEPIKNTFTYQGKTIETDFKLTNSQEKALSELVDFVNSNDRFITLQGAAGTGKTSTIGYLQKMMKGHRFVYLAPTHAATAELAFATVKLGNKILPSTVASSVREMIDPKTKEKVGAITKKLEKKLALSNNVLVIDEVSMLSAREYALLRKTMEKNDIKVIFMGDVLQIPEVDPKNPEKKLVSKAFTDNKQVVLSEVKRTSSDAILEVLENIRKNRNGKIPVVKDSKELFYFESSAFNSQLAKAVKKDPENTVLISYTNSSVKAVNTKIRESLGREGSTVKGDIIVGYAGYNSKQIEKQNVANSIRYVVDSVTKNGSVYTIAVKSSKLKYLEEKGVLGVKETAYTDYYQLSENDSLKFDDLGGKDFKSNNERISSIMSQLYEAKKQALSSNHPATWANFYSVQDRVGKFFENVNLGGEYIYNPDTNQMEEFEYQRHKDIYPELKVDKGIDYGHAITIHKSQGTTVKNVFFDANTLPKGDSSKLYQDGNLVGTEKHSLLYVGMSRASEVLVVNAENPENFYKPAERIQPEKPEDGSDKIPCTI